jgi:uncharacterized protein
MWDILIEKADVYILLVAADRPSEFHHARRIMNFMNQRVSIPMLIGVTHTDSPGAWNVDNVALALGYLPDAERPLIIPVNPNERDSVAEAIVALLETAFAGSEEQVEEESPEELAV